MDTILFTKLSAKDFKALMKESLKEILSENPQLMSGEDELPWDVDQAATFLKMKKSTLYEKTSEKSVPHLKKGNKLYFFRSQLESWLQESKVKTKKELEGEAATYTLGKEISK